MLLCITTQPKAVTVARERACHYIMYYTAHLQLQLRLLYIVVTCGNMADYVPRYLLYSSIAYCVSSQKKKRMMRCTGVKLPHFISRCSGPVDVGKGDDVLSSGTLVLGYPDTLVPMYLVISGVSAAGPQRQGQTGLSISLLSSISSPFDKVSSSKADPSISPNSQQRHSHFTLIKPLARLSTPQADRHRLRLFLLPNPLLYFGSDPVLAARGPYQRRLCR